MALVLKFRTHAAVRRQRRPADGTHFRFYLRGVGRSVRPRVRPSVGSEKVRSAAAAQTAAVQTAAAVTSTRGKEGLRNGTREWSARFTGTHYADAAVAVADALQG